MHIHLERICSIDAQIAILTSEKGKNHHALQFCLYKQNYGQFLTAQESIK